MHLFHRRGHLSRGRHGRFAQRQPEHEARAMTRLGFHPHVAAMIEDGLPRKRESQTQAIALAGADKWLEQMLTDLERDARPVV